MHSLFIQYEEAQYVVCFLDIRPEPYSPAMLVDPWRKHEQSQTLQKGVLPRCLEPLQALAGLVSIVWFVLTLPTIKSSLSFPVTDPSKHSPCFPNLAPNSGMLMFLAYSLRCLFCPFCPSDLALFFMIITLPPQLYFFSTETVLAEILMPTCLCKWHVKNHGAKAL